MKIYTISLIHIIIHTYYTYITDTELATCRPSKILDINKTRQLYMVGESSEKVGGGGKEKWEFRRGGWG